MWKVNFHLFQFPKGVPCLNVLGVKCLVGYYDPSHQCGGSHLHILLLCWEFLTWPSRYPSWIKRSISYLRWRQIISVISQYLTVIDKELSKSGPKLSLGTFSALIRYHHYLTFSWMRRVSNSASPLWPQTSVSSWWGLWNSLADLQSSYL